LGMLVIGGIYSSLITRYSTAFHRFLFLQKISGIRLGINTVPNL